MTGWRAGKRTFVEWFKQSLLGMAPSQVNMNVNVGTANPSIPMGPIGKEFNGLAKLDATTRVVSPVQGLPASAG